MKAVLRDTADAEEVGFIHENGAAILKLNDGRVVVLGGRGGDYLANMFEYGAWRKDAETFLYKGDVLEVTL